jgi:5-methylcytosine-specific restriction endonuclease McrBC GTP-binding regulatory subunit McrB
MEFEKVTKEHVYEGVKLFQERGFPKGFGDSMYYDALIDGKPFPPKPIMAYASATAYATEPINDFSGGKDEPCFNALERLGFEIRQKEGSFKPIRNFLSEFAEVADAWFEEHEWFQGRYEFFKSFFQPEHLKTANWFDFQELGKNIHAFESMAIARSNALGKPNLPIEEYRRIFLYMTSGEDPVSVTINNLYKKYDGDYFLPFFSDSSISELIGYAFPEKYVFYNRRDLAALELLGVKLPKVKSEKFGDKFSRYNQTLKPIAEAYKEIVGARTNTTINLEVDQFFSWLYVTKKDTRPITDLIESYKALVQKNGLADEKYKWQFIREYKGMPDLDKDIEEEIAKIKFPNLIYHMSVATLKVMVSQKGNELKAVFKELRDETNSLDTRVSAFIKNITKVYKSTTGENSPQQDERSLSVYLTLYYPEEYTFYKDSYYQSYCKLLGLKSAKAKKKYSHYMDLVHELSENYLSKDEELLGLVESELGDLVTEDPNLLLLAQDILYQTARARDGMNYWVFQGNPDIYDFESAIENDAIHTWSVSAHKDKISAGDKIIFWLTGTNAGCYALGEVTSEVKDRAQNEADDYWKTEDKSQQCVDIEITHNLSGKPILKGEIDIISGLKNLNGGNQGTNFNATQEEYEILLGSLENSGSFHQTKIKFDSSIFNNYIHYLRRIVKDLDLHVNDERLVFSVGDNRLNFTVGQRYCLNLFLSLSMGTYGVISKDELNSTSDNYKGSAPAPFYSYYDTFNPNADEWDSIIEAIRIELNRSSKSGFQRHNDSEFENYVFEKVNKPNTEREMNFPLNTILYGPPGTGKTYKTIDRAVQIASPADYEADNHSHNKTIYDELVESKQIQLTTFHQSLTYEDFVEGIKPKLGDESKADIEYEIRSGIFKQMCQDAKVISTKRTDIDWEKVAYAKMSLGGKARPDIHEWCIEKNQIALGWGRNEDLSPLMKYKDWDSYMKKFKELFPDLAEESRYNIQACYIFQHNLSLGDVVIATKGNNIIDAIGIVEGDYRFNLDAEIEYAQFRTVKWIATEMDASPERFFSKKISQQTIYMFDKESVKLDGFKSLSDTSHKPPKQFVLIIDEINRGNVSAIFGELITLIESDKRSGANEGLSVVLPYSKKPFSVPSNIHILGTMNTADRSVEALDTALRRRFSFVEMPPKYDLKELEQQVAGVQLSALLQTINGRIEKLIDKDHLIGHAYFINVKTNADLVSAFNDKITPLLQEYFYNDFAKIGMVLGKGFVQKKSDTQKFAIFDDGVNGDYENRDVFEIKRIEADGLKEAIADLMNQKKKTVEEA